MFLGQGEVQTDIENRSTCTLLLQSNMMSNCNFDSSLDLIITLGRI